MISPHNRSESAVCLAMVLLALGVVCSCNTPTPDPRADLVRSLKGANVELYHFATNEDEAQAIASLTNSEVRNLIKFDSAATNVILRYTSVKDKKTNTTKVYKAEITKAGAELTLLVTDFATSEVVTSKTFPVPEAHPPTDTGGGPPPFDSLEACIKDFNCTRKGALQCEADRTCEAQLAALTCCLTNGQCFSVHLIVRPSTWRCTLRDSIPDLDGLVLSQ